jgi:hypothetical protein
MLHHHHASFATNDSQRQLVTVINQLRQMMTGAQKAPSSITSSEPCRHPA